MIAELKRHILDLGLKWDPEIMIIGCRHHRDRGMEEGRYFDDRFVAVRANEDRTLVVPGTVDPGIPFSLLRNRPASWPTGVAHYESNQQFRMARHEHLGHPAFRPIDPQKVWRDANQNFQRDASEPVLETMSDLFLHAPHRGPDKGQQKEIGRSSAGCQVTASVNGMYDLHRFVVHTPGRFSPKNHYKDDIGSVWYSLIDHYLIPDRLRLQIFGIGSKGA